VLVRDVEVVVAFAGKVETVCTSERIISVAL
jgi:hypothetical protein